MAITTSLDLVNLCLVKLGAKQLAALDTTTEHGRIFTLLYPESRDELIRKLKPNCAKKRAIFHQVVDSEIEITGATAASPVVITVASHPFSDGDTIAIYDVVGMTQLNGKMYKVANSTATTFELQDLNSQNVNGSSYTAYSSGGKCGLVSTAPTYGFLYRYALPTDYIMLLEINGNERLTIPHSVEDSELLANEKTIDARYIYQLTDVTKFDKELSMLIVAKMMAETAFAITGSKTTATEKKEEYREKLAEAKGNKSQESGYPQEDGPPRNIVSNKWINSRRRGS